MTTTGRSGDIAAIRRLADDWRTGWLTGDADALLSLFTDEPVLLPQNQPPVIGKQAIRALYQSVFDVFAVQGGGEIVEVELAGDLGYFWSTYTVTATPKAGGRPLEDAGKSIFIVKRQRGEWKIARLMTSDDRAQTPGD